MFKEVGTSIVNLDRLNSISNVDTFEFANECLIPQSWYDHLHIEAELIESVGL